MSPALQDAAMAVVFVVGVVGAITFGRLALATFRTITTED